MPRLGRRIDADAIDAELPIAVGTAETVNMINGVMMVPAPIPCTISGKMNVDGSASLVKRKYIHP